MVSKFVVSDFDMCDVFRWVLDGVDHFIACGICSGWLLAL